MVFDAKWNDEKHSGKGTKFFEENLNELCCPDCFDKFIEVNQSLKYEEEITHICFMPDKAKKSQILELYKPKAPNPIFIFDEGVINIGECKLYIGKTYEQY